jgi:phospholipid/cholesterol/gamma-HCH transport system substrate-binding protein
VRAWPNTHGRSARTSGRYKAQQAGVAVIETEVNCTLVGAFVLVLGSAFVAVALWIASGGAWQKTVDLYQAVEDESVGGLNLNAPVKYNGVEVGKVPSIKLDAVNPQRVHLVFAIERATSIEIETVAVLKTQGLTGIAYRGQTRHRRP